MSARATPKVPENSESRMESSVRSNHASAKPLEPRRRPAVRGFKQFFSGYWARTLHSRLGVLGNSALRRGHYAAAGIMPAAGQFRLIIATGVHKPYWRPAPSLPTRRAATRWRCSHSIELVEFETG